MKNETSKTKEAIEECFMWTKHPILGHDSVFIAEFVVNPDVNGEGFLVFSTRDSTRSTNTAAAFLPPPSTVIFENTRTLSPM